MIALYSIVAVILLATLLAGMYQVMRGPTAGDRMLAGQLFGTIAVAVLLLGAEATGDPVLVDVALVFALLAAVTVVAFVRRAWPEKDVDDPSA